MNDAAVAGTSAGASSAGCSAPLKILLISFRFPPAQSVGAVSVGKTAKYLVALGHEVRVVTARDQQVPTTLPLEVDPRSIVATSWLNPMRLAEPLSGGRDRVAESGFSAGRRNQGLVHRLGSLYRSLMIPDKELGWWWPAFRAARALAAEWRPDLIYASAPPYTAFLAARAVATRTGIPWVAGFRDLWADYPHGGGTLRRHLDRALESRVLRTAAGVVVTSDEAAAVVRARHDMSVATVMNGYDPDEIRERRNGSGPGELRIVYTGVLMHDQRDPRPLFHAMREIRAEGRTVVADFFGRDSAMAARAAEVAGVGDLVSAHDPIPYGASLQAQRDADVLLLIQSSDPAERHTCPAKLFEYAAARRPILFIGPDKGVVGRLVREFDLGVVVQRPEQIADELRRSLHVKEGAGWIPDLGAQPPPELSRIQQVEKLARYFSDVARSRAHRAQER